MDASLTLLAEWVNCEWLFLILVMFLRKLSFKVYKLENASV